MNPPFLTQRASYAVASNICHACRVIGRILHPRSRVKLPCMTRRAMTGRPYWQDPEGLRVFYYLVQDLKCFVFSLINLHMKIKPI